MAAVPAFRPLPRPPFTTPTSAGSSFNLQIEGIRAVAIILVVLYHAGVPWFSGGFIGVDVFLVVSGFLITSQLSRELAKTGHIDLPKFWARRVRRLVPMGAIVVVSTVWVGSVLLPPEQVRELERAGVAALCYVSNFQFVAASYDYFGALVAQNALLHTWSLGVEAQFYLAWPFVLIVTPARWRLAAISALVIASFGVSALLTPQAPIPAYYLIPTRLWELAAGGALALSKISWNSPLLGWAGLALIAIAATTFNVHSVFPGYLALLPVLGTVSMMLAARAERFRWLGWAPIALVGSLSYSWYLWHWPVIVFADRINSGLGMRIGSVVASFLIALVTYKAAEVPARAWATRSLRPGTTLLLGALVTFFAIGLTWLAVRGIG